MGHYGRRDHILSNVEHASSVPPPVYPGRLWRCTESRVIEIICYILKRWKRGTEKERRDRDKKERERRKREEREKRGRECNKERWEGEERRAAKVERDFYYRRFRLLMGWALKVSETTMKRLLFTEHDVIILCAPQINTFSLPETDMMFIQYIIPIYLICRFHVGLSSDMGSWIIHYNHEFMFTASKLQNMIIKFMIPPVYAIVGADRPGQRWRCINNS